VFVDGHWESRFGPSLPHSVPASRLAPLALRRLRYRLRAGSTTLPRKPPAARAIAATPPQSAPASRLVSFALDTCANASALAVERSRAMPAPAERAGCRRAQRSGTPRADWGQRQINSSRQG